MLSDVRAAMIRVRELFRHRSQSAADQRDEFSFHIEMETAENIRRGMSEAGARRAALLRFGGTQRFREETSDARGVVALDNLARDAGYAVRRLRAHTAYTSMAVLTLALGVGGTAAVYGVARKILFQPLPYAHERDIGVFWKKTDWNDEEFLFIRGRTPGFRQVALYRHRDVILREDGRPARLLSGISASRELFDVLGAQPILGRSFEVGDDLPGAEPVAVLSFALWRELGGDASVLGRRVMIDGESRTIVGVMPREFWFPDPAVRIWTPEPLAATSRSWNSTLIGRVAPNYDVRAMTEPIGRLTAMLGSRFDYPAQWDKTRDARITPIRDDLIGEMRPALLAVLSAMALILLVACANIAALMLGQVAARSTEFALRVALGATQKRLIQQLIVETMLVATAAGALGAALAWAGLPLLAHALPLGPWADAASPGWTLFAWAMIIASIAAPLAVFMPALTLRRKDLREVLAGARTAGLNVRHARLESLLVVTQVALAVLIASGACLLARSVAKLHAVDPGVRAHGVAVIDLMIGDDRRRTIDELTTALGALPGVHSSGLTQILPLRGGGYNLPMTIAGDPQLVGATTEYRIVTPGYLESAGIRLRRGRTITRGDGPDAERVVIINEALAAKYFSGVDPIGKRLGGDFDDKLARIVGVVANAAERGLTDAPEPVRYIPMAQAPWVDEPQSMLLQAEPGIDEASLLEPARRVIQRMAPGVAVQETTTMRRVVDAAIGPARQVMTLLSVLTMLALTLGSVGIYGVISNLTARHRRDWAIRVVLGLTAARVITGVMGHGARLLVAGVGVGVVAGAVVGRALASLLYGVQTTDTIALAGAATMLLSVGLFAALIPAWRAGVIDPASVLREP